MKKTIRNILFTIISMGVLSSQVMGVCAAPATVVPIKAEVSASIPEIGREELVAYYNENFDVEAYKKAYPDLVTEFGETAEDAIYINHYLNYGIKEGRTAGGFDSVAFIVNNYEYFLQHGIDETFVFFNVDKYMAANADLQDAFGKNKTLYLYHYLTKGILEGRSSCGAIDLVSFSKAYPNSNIKSNIDASKLSSDDMMHMFRPEDFVVNYAEYEVKEPENENSASDTKKDKDVWLDISKFSPIQPPIGGDEPIYWLD